MRFLDVVVHALGNLRRQKLRTSLTVTGVAIGVFTTAVMMAFPAGVQNILASKLDKQELLTTMSVFGRRMPRSFDSLDQFRRFQAQAHDQKPVPLDDDLVDELKKIQGVIAVYPDFATPLTCELEEMVDNEYTVGIPVDGLTQSYQEALLAGAYWKEGTTGGVCVLPSASIEKYGFKSPRDAIGRRVALSKFQEVFRYSWDPPADEKLAAGARRRAIRPKGLEPVELDVIGVYDSEPFGILGGRILVPLKQGEKLQKLGFWRKPREGQYHSLTLKVVDRHVVDRVREELDGRQLGTLMTADALKALNWVFTAIEIGLGMFGGIALFVSLFGIANTMVMAVLERTREIGILKALGGRDRDVGVAFMTEAGAIGFLGGIGGIGIGLAACAVFNWIATRYLTTPSLKGLEVFQISLPLGLGLVAFSTFVSTLAGVYPAWRAARLDPVEALRRE